MANPAAGEPSDYNGEIFTGKLARKHLSFPTVRWPRPFAPPRATPQLGRHPCLGHSRLRHPAFLMTGDSRRCCAAVPCHSRSRQIALHP